MNNTIRMSFSFKSFPILETKKLDLRQIKLSDRHEIFFLRSDKEVNKYIKRDLSKSELDAEKFIKRITVGFENGENINWSIGLKGCKKMIGSICLWNFSADGLKAEVGYDLYPNFQKQGIMSEALQVVLNYGFEELQLTETYAFTNYKNENSVKMLLRNKFSLLENRKDDDNIDNKIFSIKRAMYLYGNKDFYLY